MKIEELKGKRVKVSAHTITVQDDNYKTRGMVRNVENLYEIRSNRQFEFAKRLQPIGRDVYMGHLEQILIVDNKMYFLCDDYSLEMSRKYDEPGRGLAFIVDTFENSGLINVIHCERVMYSERRK